MKLDPFIEAEQADGRSVKRCCELFEVSRAAYYQRASVTPTARELSDAELLEHIREIHDESDGTYGSPRVTAELRRRGHHVGRRRVGRLMRCHRLEGRAKKRRRATTIADPDSVRHKTRPSSSCAAGTMRRHSRSTAARTIGRRCRQVRSSKAPASSRTPTRVLIQSSGRRHLWAPVNLSAGTSRPGSWGRARHTHGRRHRHAAARAPRARGHLVPPRCRQAARASSRRRPTSAAPDPGPGHAGGERPGHRAHRAGHGHPRPCARRPEGHMSASPRSTGGRQTARSQLHTRAATCADRHQRTETAPPDEQEPDVFGDSLLVGIEVLDRTLRSVFAASLPPACARSANPRGIRRRG